MNRTKELLMLLLLHIVVLLSISQDNKSIRVFSDSTIQEMPFEQFDDNDCELETSICAIYSYGTETIVFNGNYTGK